MNGVEIFGLPKFLEGEPLPQGYLDPPNPYVNPPTRKVNLGEMLKYARSKGKKCWDLTKEEIQMFETK